ncbi:hypothetical protein LY90DRAFT_82493 [Neocallimastix californiae]|uniref:HMG box domain-containing protein n=1 Tax=Neocallimastix californiae TaxID=1754190 RepID=A0A1Y2B5D4_9FUNG|nr:hypothetical protein LY90DRAFT_82493 [Neocallimastix californiae]|eukprot:ORY30051.1 hypothetical protein LY90DRAFT_82493 [Neocallimastix californiae]
MANYGQMSMNNIGMNMNTIGMTVNNTTTNNANGVQVNGLNNIAIPTRVNVINPLAVGNSATAIRNVNGNYGMVVTNQNMQNLQLRNGLNANNVVGTNRIVGTAGLTYANANPVLQQRVATASQISTANMQNSNIYNQYQFNPNIVNTGKKNVTNLSPVNNATSSIGNIGQRLVQTYSTTNLQNTQFQKPIQVNTITPQNIQLINQNAVLAKTATVPLNQPQIQQQKNVITTPIQQTGTPIQQTGTPVLQTGTSIQQTGTSIQQTGTPVLQTGTSIQQTGTPVLQTGTSIQQARTSIQQTAITNTSTTTTALNDPTKIKQEALTTNVATPTSLEKIATNKTIENLNQPPVQEIKKENITTPIATTNPLITSLTPNSEGSNEVSKVNNTSNLNKNGIKIEKNEVSNVSKPTLSEGNEAKKNQISTPTTQSTNTGAVISTNTYKITNGTQNKTTTINTNNGVSYNQAQNMYQKQYINAPTAVNYPQAAVANNFQVNKAYYPAGSTNQATYLNQYAVKPINGNPVGNPVGIPQQKYYTVANGTYSNVNGTIQPGIKTINPTGPITYTVANNQKYVITNPTTNNVITGNRGIQGVNQYPVNNTMTNVYQVANNNTVKVSNGYIPNNGQVVMNSINNGQVSYVKVNPTVNGNVMNNGSNLVNYGTNATMINGAQYINKTGLPNQNLMTTAVNANGTFAKPLTTGPGEPNSKYLMNSQMSSFLLTPPTVSTTTSSRRRNDILRPPNPFILYRQEHHSKVLAEHEGISNTEISKIIGKMWKEESEEVKNKYKEKAQEMKRRHKLMYPDYRFSPRKQEEIRRRKKRKNVNPAPESTDSKKDESKKEENKKEGNAAEENIENAKKKLKTETSAIDTTKAAADASASSVSASASANTTTLNSTTNEIKKEGNLNFLNDLTVSNSLSAENLNSVLDITSSSNNPNIKTEATTTTTNIPTTTEESSNNIVSNNSLFNDLNTSLADINSFDIDNFHITEDNSFIDDYLNFSSNHTFQTTSDSMFNQLTDLINNNKK